MEGPEKHKPTMRATAPTHIFADKIETNTPTSIVVKSRVIAASKRVGGKATFPTSCDVGVSSAHKRVGTYCSYAFTTFGKNNLKLVKKVTNEYNKK